MVRVLHSVSNMDRAGIETMLMNYYRYMDRNKIQFDFLCNKIKPGAYDSEIKSMGGRIFHTPGLNPIKYFKYLKYMRKLFRKYPEYKIIEAHNGALGVYALYAAKINNIPNRIFHAHGASITKDWKLPIKLFCKSRLKSNINYKFSCGIAAAECYFGKKTVIQGNYEFIPNAIEVERFLFNKEVRNKLREQYNLKNKHVIGHVGRFMAQKNHSFLLEVFTEYLKVDKKAVLVLLGDGELMNSIKKKVSQKNISDKVIFIGNVSNVNEWYSVFDLFVLPSIWEGLPVVGIEAQASDLPCVFSTSITREISLSDKVKFISLKSNIQEWVDAFKCSIKNTDRKDNTELLRSKSYDIKTEAIKLQNRYLEIAGVSCILKNK